jgi:hypothetical protein
VTAPNTTTLVVKTATINWSTFGLVFTAGQFLVAARVVIASEIQEEGNWHPVGKYLACHSIELSFKAFLMLKGETLVGARRFSHRIGQLLAACQKQNLKELVPLTERERSEIKRADPYYDGKVFEYPFVAEAARGYPGDPDVAPLLSAAERLVDGLHEPCRDAT